MPPRILNPYAWYWCQRSYLLLKILLSCNQTLNCLVILNSRPVLRSNPVVPLYASPSLPRYCGPSHAKRSAFHHRSFMILHFIAASTSNGIRPHAFFSL